MEKAIYPQTLEEAVNLLVDLLTEEQREDLENTPEEYDVSAVIVRKAWKKLNE